MEVCCGTADTWHLVLFDTPARRGQMNMPRYACSRCLAPHDEPGFCPSCGLDTLLDRQDPVERDILQDKVRQRSANRSLIAAMGLWLLAVLLCVPIMRAFEPLLALLSPQIEGIVVGIAGPALAVVLWIPGLLVVLRSQRAAAPQASSAALEVTAEPASAAVPEEARRKRPQRQPVKR